MFATSSAEVEFRSRRGRLWCGVAGSVLFVLCGAGIAIGGAAAHDVFTGVLGLVCMLFFGWTTWLWAGQALHAGEVVLTIGPAGVHDHRLTTAPVPWNDIIGLSTWSTAGSTLVVVEVSEDVWARGIVRPLARRSRSANAALGADGLSINPLPIAVKAGALVTLIRDEAARYGKQLA